VEELLLSVVNVYGISDISQTEIHSPELVISEPSSFEVEIAIGKLKRYESDTVQILV
jgi:hypothetical protein